MRMGLLRRPAWKDTGSHGMERQKLGSSESELLPSPHGIPLSINRMQGLVAICQVGERLCRMVLMPHFSRSVCSFMLHLRFGPVGNAAAAAAISALLSVDSLIIRAASAVRRKTGVRAAVSTYFIALHMWMVLLWLWHFSSLPHPEWRG